MATISGADLVLLREQQQQTTLYLSVLQPYVLLTASVNDGAIARGARTIAYDGGVAGGASAFAAIAAGQTLEVDTPKGTQKVRLKAIAGVANAGTITVAENTINWQDGQVIRVLHNYEPWPIPPTIRGGVFYKDYDIIHNEQNWKPNPVAILGPNFVTLTSPITLPKNANESYAMADGATISTRVLTCLKGDGTAAAVAEVFGVFRVTFPSCGQYWLTLVVTDSNGKTATTHRCMWYYDFVTCSPYTDFQMTGLSGDWGGGGWRFSLNVTGDVELSDFPDNSLALVWCRNYFNNAEDYVNIWYNSGHLSQDKIICEGYIRNDSDRDSLAQGTGSVSFEVTTIEAVMDKMSLSGSVSLNAITTIPAFWYEYEHWLTVGRAIHHLLLWHSTITEIVDVYGLMDNLLGLKTADFAEPTLYQMCNSLTNERGIMGKLVSDRMGRLHLVEDTQLWNDTDRAALDTCFTLSIADVSDTVELVRQQEEAAGVVEVSGFFFDGTTSTPYIAIASGYQSGGVSFGLPNWRGGGSDMRNFQVLASQADCNEKAGRLLAAENNELRELRITSPANYLGAFDIVPSIGMYNWGLADALFKRDLSLSGLNLICRNVSANMIADGVLQSNVVFEIEAQGEDGIPGNYPVGYPAIVIPSPPVINTDPGEGYFFAGYADKDNPTTTNVKVCYIQPNGTIQAAQTLLGDGGTSKFFYICQTRLSATTGISLLANGTGGGVSAFVLTFGANIAIGAEQEILAISNVILLSYEALDSTRSLLVYQKFTSATNYYISAVVVTNTSGTVTAGVPAIIYTYIGAAGGGTAKAAVLSPSLAIVSYSIWLPATGSMSAVALSISGATITVNAAVDSAEAASAYLVLSILPLSATTAVVNYEKGAAGAYDSRCAIISVAGVIVTFNGGYSIFTHTDTGASVGEPGCRTTAISPLGFVCLSGYSTTNDKANVRIKGCTVAGTVITAGTEVALLADGVLDTFPSVATKFNTNVHTIVYLDANTFKRVTVTSNGTVIVSNANVTTGETVAISKTFQNNYILLNAVK